MAIVTYSCTKCKPIDRSILQVYLTLKELENTAYANENERVAAEESRVEAEAARADEFAVLHEQAGGDHGVAVGDHTRAESDHSTFATDHENAVADRNGYASDHSAAVSDHETASSDHARAGADHITAGNDHATAVADHSRATSDHGASATATALAEYAAQVALDAASNVGKYYGVFLSADLLPTDDDTPGYALVGTTSPLKVYNYDGLTWTDSGAEIDSIKGDTGETPDISIGTVTTVEPGTPAAASMTGTPEAPVLNLSIPKGLVGATPNITVGTVTTGQPGTPVVVTITGTPEAPVLNLTIPQGMQGNTGSSVAYPYELVNNLTTNDATKGLSAAQGVVLDGKVTQLEAKKADKDTVRAYMMTIRAKQALLAVFEKVAFAFPDVSIEMAELENSLFNLDEIVGIEATYTQGDTVVYDQGVNILDDLKEQLIVKAVYGDGTKVPIQSYTLSGDITTAGTDTVSVYFLGFTDTFDVVVTHYTAQMVFSMSDGDIEKYQGSSGRYDNNTKYCISNFGSSANRRTFAATSGVQSMVNAQGTAINIYPVPIPRNAKKVTVTVTPATTNVSGGILYLENGLYPNITGTRFLPSEPGTQTYIFPAEHFDLYRKGGWYFYGSGLKSSGNYSSSDEPTNFVITFE